MIEKKIARQSIYIDNVYIKAYSAVAGENESKGFFGKYFDRILEGSDSLFGTKSFEQAEKKMMLESLMLTANKADISFDDIDLFTGGDLLNQIISTAYNARDIKIPFLGLYNACSTICEAVIVASMAISGGFTDNAISAVSSHFGSAERQFRAPNELGTPKPPSAQNTVTASSSILLSSEVSNLRIVSATIGKVIDFGINDANNMGAAMAPSAASTILTHIENREKAVNDYDLIITGDLGNFGSEMLCEMCQKCGYDISEKHLDCGSMMYRKSGKNPYSGGSGCACGASALCSYFLPQMENGKYRRILFCATGALHSPVSIGQGESIPGISHAIEIISK